MQIISGSLFFAPSDLITYMESAFATHMERQRLTDKEIKNLMDPEDPMLVTLRRKGYAHEDAYLESLKAEGKNVVEIGDTSKDVMLCLRSRPALQRSSAQLLHSGRRKRESWLRRI
jgi:hypothetical protein